MTDRPSAVIVGAGVFGAALALALTRRDWAVTVLERATPGHAGASSGGDSRLLRSSHGGERWYTQLAWSGRAAWRALQTETGEHLLADTGIVWFARDDVGWEADSERVCAELRIPVERLPADRVGELFPSVRTDDLAFGLLEPQAGVLRARVAVRAMIAQAQREGATLRSGVTGRVANGAVGADGQTLHADRIVWACGPWLPALFGDRLGLSVTQQDTCYFTVPASWRADRVPAWVDFGGAAYGTGDLDGHGFKCSTDRQGPPFDPEGDDRTPVAAHVTAARELLAHRFPALAGAPIAGTRTCQYTTTVDTEFLIAPLDETDVAWVAGGGSGHAFKHGPALGELVADMLDGSAEADPRFGLAARAASGSLRTAGHEG